MKVVFVSHDAALAGAEQALAQLVATVQTLGTVECHVVLPHEGPLLTRLRGVGARVHVIRHYWWAAPHRRRWELAGAAAMNVRAVTLLTRLVRRIQADAVVTSTLAVPAGAIAARLAGLPHIWMIHEFADERHGYKFLLGRQRTLRVIGRLSDRVVFASEVLRNAMGPFVGRERSSVAHYGFDADARPLGAPVLRQPMTPALLALGRMSSGKGQRDAVEAVALLRRDGIAATLRIVGSSEGDSAHDLAQLATTLGIGSAVSIEPPTDDPMTVIDASDIVVVCSRSEGFSRVVVEAMLRARPVIAAEGSGGPEEILAMCGPGAEWLYGPGNASDLAAVVRTLVSNVDRTQHLARTSRTVARERFSPDAYASAVLATLESIV